MSAKKSTVKKSKIKQVKSGIDLKQTNQNQTITSFFNKQNSSVKCPACAKLVLKTNINSHLDNFCTSSTSNEEKIVEITIEDTEEKTKKRKSDDETSEKSPKKFKTAENHMKRPYYLDNFVLVLKAVTNHPEDSNLLDSNDKKIVETFLNLSIDAQKLYIRIFQRKLKWHRMIKLDYDEIKSDLNELINELITNKFFIDGETIELNDILNLMQLNDLKILLKSLNMNQLTNKSEIIANIMKQCKKQKTLFAKTMDFVILKEAKKINGKCFKLENETRRIFNRIFLLFSLTSYVSNDDQKQQQQIFTLHLVNTNRLIFPDYSVLRSAVIFRDRNDLIAYEKMYQIELDLLNSIGNGNFQSGFEIYSICCDLYSSKSIENDDLNSHVANLPNFLRRYTAGASLVRCLSHGVEILERLRQYEKAVKQLEDLINQNDYHLDYRGRWTERLALNLEQHLKQPKKALEVIIKGLNDQNIRGGHKLGLHQRITRICNSKNTKFKNKLKKIKEFEIRQIPKNLIEGRNLPSTSGYKSTFVTQSFDSSDVVMMSVEEFALNHYKTNGFDRGIHGESSIFTSLFALLFWDVIYTSGIPDVFRSPHQMAPLDLNDDCFYLQRKSDLDEILEWIKRSNVDEICDRISVVWDLNHGKTSLVDWELFGSIEYLESLCRCIDCKILAQICERLAIDYRFTRSGFPDLVVWSTVETKFKVVEVKGPNDRLSTKQILWLDFLLGIGVSAEVCHVANSGKRLKKITDD